MNTKYSLPAMPLAAKFSLLEATHRALELGRERQSLDQRHWQVAKKALSRGEMDVQSAIQALQQYRESLLYYQLTDLSYQQLIGEFSQIDGASA